MVQTQIGDVLQESICIPVSFQPASYVADIPFCGWKMSMKP